MPYYRIIDHELPEEDQDPDDVEFVESEHADIPLHDMDPASAAFLAKLRDRKVEALRWRFDSDGIGKDHHQPEARLDSVVVGGVVADLKTWAENLAGDGPLVVMLQESFDLADDPVDAIDHAIDRLLLDLTDVFAIDWRSDLVSLYFTCTADLTTNMFQEDFEE